MNGSNIRKSFNEPVGMNGSNFKNETLSLYCFFYISAYLPICLSAYLPIHIHVHIHIHIHVHVHIYIYIYIMLGAFKGFIWHTLLARAT